MAIFFVPETRHQRNIQKVLEHAMALAERAGAEEDVVRRERLLDEAMLAWRTAQMLRRSPR